MKKGIFWGGSPGQGQDAGKLEPFTRFKSRKTVDGHIDCHGGQSGPGLGGSAGRAENPQGGVQRAPTGETRQNGVAGCSLALHRCYAPTPAL